MIISYLPYRVSAILHYCKNTVCFTVGFSPPNFCGRIFSTFLSTAVESWLATVMAESWLVLPSLDDLLFDMPQSKWRVQLAKARQKLSGKRVSTSSQSNRDRTDAPRNAHSSEEPLQRVGNSEDLQQRLDISEGPSFDQLNWEYTSYDETNSNVSNDGSDESSVDELGESEFEDEVSDGEVEMIQLSMVLRLSTGWNGKKMQGSHLSDPMDLVLKGQWNAGGDISESLNRRLWIPWILLISLRNNRALKSQWNGQDDQVYCG